MPARIVPKISLAMSHPNRLATDFIGDALSHGTSAFSRFALRDR
ncbi:hypothetical protein RBWH47_00669 [Rhodopirellula baltica WH47]|nr:hypothetical protein RBWH47_00669 [Rhodopirellula baltica WH47]